MFASARMEKIKELMKEIKKIEISSLVSILQVSEATIRRDLEKLEQEGFLYRTHGGAVLIEPKEPEAEAEIENSEEKNLVGYIAAQLVNDGQIIFVGDGTTCLAMCKHLKNKRDLTVVTNNVEASLLLKKESDASVVLTGGTLHTRKDSVMLCGEFARNMLKGIFVDTAFLGVSGIDLNNGYAADSPECGMIWKLCHEIASETAILSDSSKFDRKSLFPLGPLDCVSRVITDKGVPDAFREYYFSKGIPIYTSYALDAHKDVNAI